MEIFRELFIRGDARQVAATLDEMGREVQKGWVRDRKIESSLQLVESDGRGIYCYASNTEGHLTPAIVFITEKLPGTVHVSNISPRAKERLTIGEYNAVLEDFCNVVVRPAIEKTGSTLELTENHAELTNWLSSEAVNKLRSISSLPAGTYHSYEPYDQDRWFDFVVTAHRERSTLDSSTLRRWLIEVENWPPEVATRLGIEYSFGGDLLDYCEGKRRRA